MKIVCVDPCTFFCSDSPIKVLDRDKKIFYFHPNKEGAITFNLPKGTFYTENKIQQRVFQPYEVFEKPAKYISPAEFEIKVKKNPKKATISIPNRTITFDPCVAYHDYQPALVFVLGHEIFHTAVGGNIYHPVTKQIMFDAEKACDNFSANWMLSHGYNPNQIKFAVKLILSNSDRKECIANQFNYRR